MNVQLSTQAHIKNFEFNHLPAHELVPFLVHQSTALNKNLDWHICWLNNNGKPVIGLLPKIAWSALPTNTHSAKTKTSEKSLNDVEIIQSIRKHNSLDIHDKNDNYGLKTKYSHQTYTTDFNDWIATLIDYSNQHVEKQTSSQHTYRNIYSYQNGLMGFIGYDITAKNLSPNSGISVANQPCAFLAHYDIYLTLDRYGNWQLLAHKTADKEAINDVTRFLESLENPSKNKSEREKPEKLSESYPSLKLHHYWQFNQYESAFKRTQDYLYSGDSYQINLTQKWHGKLEQATSPYNESDSLSLVNYLASLINNTQAPYAGYLNINKYLNNDDSLNVDLHNGVDDSRSEFELLSCSPELFVLFEKDEKGQQRILTKPIKGTVPRGKTPEQDEQLKQQLSESEKDKAENVMIVDLLRNDLGKYAKTGSVQVPKLFAIESFSNVHHMVSSITATIKEEHHPLTVLFDSLPAGSITGTPKKRAVEIISELEAEPRGAYCGTMGYLNFDGTGQWNVLIRTLQADTQGNVCLWAGGGITVGSECRAEYQECHDKVSNLIGILDPDVNHIHAN